MQVFIEPIIHAIVLRLRLPKYFDYRYCARFQTPGFHISVNDGDGRCAWTLVIMHLNSLFAWYGFIESRYLSYASNNIFMLKLDSLGKIVQHAYFSM